MICSQRARGYIANDVTVANCSRATPFWAWSRRKHHWFALVRQNLRDLSMQFRSRLAKASTMNRGVVGWCSKTLLHHLRCISIKKMTQFVDGKNDLWLWYAMVGQSRQRLGSRVGVLQIRMLLPPSPHVPCAVVISTGLWANLISKRIFVTALGDRT